MRLLHTSDWHLGQSLHNFDRHYEHQCFLDWLLETIVAEQADALLIAGDVFDNANPSAVSQRQLYRFLQQARERVPGLDIVVTAGNHDSPGRIEAPGPLLEAHGTRVIGHVLRDDNGNIDVGRMVLPLTNRAGHVAAWCLAVPFLRPADVPRGGQDETVDGYLAGIAALYAQAQEHALSLRQPGQAVVAMGHCHMVDGQMSADSERRIVIGGTEMLPAGMFGPEVAYAALGHLHLAQQIGRHAHIRYCGSPIPLSFSEVHYQHQVLRIDLDGGALQETVAIPIPRAVHLLRVPSRPAPLAQVLDELEALDFPAAPPYAQPFLEVRVLLDAPEPGLRSRIEAALEGKHVRLAKIDTASSARGPSLVDAAVSLDQLAQLQPDEVFARLYRQKYGNDAPDDQVAAFAELLLAGV
ncbi:exonuclease SbcCD subunit D C-terminal domain-containing protein [Pseudoduganella plicata]|uniref:Nuclease SbcCD subunit D n=1 Tax=Pseudoduganella plicata TaxID=321984 RepID=A0A4P7BCK4_9BURK|nr:exonuclease SbcCD subunit D C-terminal domain-containing protein [Pseudoduganella plicata]QBQ35890.1 exonuclease subunit SbcD [Pseudoduganella plicata]GGY94285.1 nuclease SbcCD subunit D [Pseudoduganella plicata]